MPAEAVPLKTLEITESLQYILILVLVKMEEPHGCWRKFKIIGMLLGEHDLAAKIRTFYGKV